MKIKKKVGTAIFSTGDLAKMLEVTPVTVGHWIDNGYLVGYRSPGPRRPRKVHVEEVKNYLKEHTIFDIDDLVEWV